MKKILVLLILSLFVITSCGEEDVTGVAKITVNGTEFTQSVECSATSSTDFSISAKSTNGDSIALNIESNDSSLVYVESGKSYMADEDSDGSLDGTYNGKTIKINFDIKAKLNSIGEEKTVKGTAECTPGGSKD